MPDRGKESGSRVVKLLINHFLNNSCMENFEIENYDTQVSTPLNTVFKKK